MHPTRKQQLAIKAILNALIGPGEFDRLCLGMRVECVEDGILYVFVPNEDGAAKIEDGCVRVGRGKPYLDLMSLFSKAMEVPREDL